MHNDSEGILRSCFVSEKILMATRVASLLFMTAFHIDCVYLNGLGAPLNFIFLTNWTFFLVNIYFAFAVAVMFVPRMATALHDVMPLFHATTVTMAVVVMCLFWFAVYPTKRDPVQLCTVVTHGVQAMLMLIDMVFSRVRFDFKRDAKAVAVYMLVYASWSLVWFAFHPDRPIYPILNWRSYAMFGVLPGALGFILGVLYGLCRLSKWKEGYLPLGTLDLSLGIAMDGDAPMSSVSPDGTGKPPVLDSTL